MKPLVLLCVAGVLAAQNAPRKPAAAPSTAPAAAPAAAASSGGISREQADEIIRELREIRKVLERATTPQRQEPEPDQKAKITVSGGYTMGSPSAPVTIVEYMDYQCSFCRRYHMTSFPEIKKNFIDTGKVRFVARDLPLDFHKNAFAAAEAARCAGDQGKFWELRGVLVTNADKLERGLVDGYAASLNLDMGKFKGCMDGRTHKAAVERDIAEAGALNINGTPGFVIGRTTADGVDGTVLLGAHPYPAFETRIRQYQ